MKDGHLKVSLRSSPHIWRGMSVRDVMRTVFISLLPLAVAAVYFFGLSALLLMLITTLSAVFTEYIFCKIIGKKSTVGDYSAAITGLLLAMTLPPAFPLWLGALGGIVAILLGKAIFGGLGFNPFNPALVGRAFLQASFPVAITTWSGVMLEKRFTEIEPASLTIPFTNIVPTFKHTSTVRQGKNDIDAVSGATASIIGINQTKVETPDAVIGATPLAQYKFEKHQSADYMDLIYGTRGGSLGETSAILIVIIGIFLFFKGLIDWRIPIGIISTVFVFSSVLHAFNPDCPPPLYMLLSGGLLFGAVFMATDMVTSPVTKLGTWSYAVLIGSLVVLIRVFGALPEGVMYAILFANGVTPLLNRCTQPRIYGQKSK